MDATCFFESQFRPRLENQLLGFWSTLTDDQLTRVKSWIDLFTETNESLQSRSRQQWSLRRRALYFAKRVLAIGNELFVLCSSSNSISGIGSIRSKLFYGLLEYLEEWWISKGPPESLRKATNGIRQILPQNENAQHSPANSSLQRQPEEGGSQPLVAQSPYGQALPLTMQRRLLVGEGK